MVPCMAAEAASPQELLTDDASFEYNLVCGQQTR